MRPNTPIAGKDRQKKMEIAHGSKTMNAGSAPVKQAAQMIIVLNTVQNASKSLFFHLSFVHKFGPTLPRQKNSPCFWN